MLTVEQFIDACRAKGLNVTYQRLLIYKTLARTKSHPTAESIYHEVKTEYPSISLATVYKTLETLAEHNLIQKVTPLHDLARYDGDTNPHHHLVCLECRKIVDVYDEHLNQLKMPEDKNFRIHGYRIQFEGICDECASKERVKSSTESVQQIQ
ncbi:MAG: transcriptional repressor [Calditrichaeota bacterium]|nr:MAG: transcriptional repressor [Calditrichota bacterium]